MGDLHLVLPALNLSTLLAVTDCGILDGGLHYFNVSPNLLGTNLGFELVWTELALWTQGLGPGLDNTDLLTLTNVGDGGHAGDEPELGMVKHHKLAIGCEAVIALVGQTAAIASNVLKWRQLSVIL